MGAEEAGALVARYIKLRGLTQTTVAHEVTQQLKAVGKDQEVHQGHVSAHTRGERWNFDLPGAYIRVLDIPESEMVDAWGWTNDGKRKRRATSPAPVTLADVIKADDTLSPAAKKHLLSQYGLLQMASREERKGQPVLPESNKSRRSV